MPRIRTVEGSCWACKERRVICDLKQPNCDKCTKTGRSCDYARVRLRWTDCVASRGHLAGKKIPKPITSLSLSQSPVLQKDSDHHILYFERELLPRFNISNTIPTVDLNLLARDPILIQSVIAVANAHHTYYNRESDEKLSLSRIQERNNALRVFRQHLMTAENDAVNSSLFIANVLLCILDGIVEPSAEKSATHHHLMGGKALLKHWGGMASIFAQKLELPILMLSIFATMDLTHSLLIGDAPFSQPSNWAEFGDSQSWWGNVKSDDNFLEVMSILSQLAKLGNKVYHLNETIPIGNLLSIQMAIEQSNRQDVEPSDDLAWAAYCSVYRFTASLYLYRALSGLDVDHPLVQKAVAGCMEIIGGTDLTHKLHHCILFPALVIGAHCMDEVQREQIRKSVVQTAAYLSFESLRSFQNFLEQRWVALDMRTELAERSVCCTLTWWQYFDQIAAASCLF